MEEHHEKFVEVRVITTSGIYPEVGFERVNDHEHVETCLLYTSYARRLSGIG